MPALTGTYVFGDFTRRLDNRHGRIFGVNVTNPSPVAQLVDDVRGRDGPIDAGITGFGQDAAKELYVLTVNRDGTGGAVMRLDQARP